MTSTVVFSDTDIAQAKLVSKLSNRPARVHGDVFIWNGILIDRASAIVALLKINNQVPVNDSVKCRLYQNYETKFMELQDKIKIKTEETDATTLAKVWFHRLCSTLKNNELLKNSEVKQILIDLHTE